MRSRLSGGTVPQCLAGDICVAGIWYLWDAGTTGQIHLNVNDGTSDLGSDTSLVQTSGEYKQALVRFTCPVQGTNIRIELESTADAAAVTLDQAFLGNDKTVLTNVLPLVAETTDTVTNFGTTGTYTHNGNVPVADQQWIATVSISGGDDLQLDNGWITDKTTAAVDYDFTGLAGADTVTLKLFDTRVNTSHANNLGVNFTYGPNSAAPATTLPHGLGIVPRSITVQHEGQTAAGQWDDVTSANHCSFDATNVYCDFAALTIDATHRIFVGLSTATNPSFITDELTFENLIVNQQASVGSGALPDANTIFHVQDESTGFTPTNNSDLLLEGDTSAYLGILTEATGTGGIVFMQDGDANRSIIDYRHSTDDMHFRVNDTEDVLKLQSDGTAVFNVQDDGVSSCPDGGNVCSGSDTLTCTGVNNVASCTAIFQWVRVGNKVFGSVQGNMQPNAVSAFTRWDLSGLPFNSVYSNFSTVSQGGSTCVWKSAGPGTQDHPGYVLPLSGTKNMRVDLNHVSHTFNNPYACSVTYTMP
jgi:hypothetical protein